MSTLMGNEVITNKRYSQVQLATYRGDIRLPYMNRSFISFSYGGKNIEDFNLIAVTDGDRINRLGYSQFEDTISTYSNLSGLQCWSTHYKANELELTLATDGIDLKMLEDFLHWFIPGTARELILAEHPNRAILARVSAPPQLNLLPFSQLVEVKISRNSYSTYTTLYKGDINLKFIMDQPHWYALDNVLGIKEDNRYIDRWIDPNGESVSIFASLDALKILYEDGIPLGSMILNDMLLGNGAYAQVEDNIISHIWSLSEELIEWSGGEWGQGDPTGLGARIEANNATFPYTKGVIAGAIMDASGKGISSLPEGAKGYFYYSGTAPAPTIIQFTMVPMIRDDKYLICPRNKHSTGGAYNIITIESINKLELCFTTPNLYTSYNKALDIFKAYVLNNNKNNFETIREHIREEVRHVAVREYANYVLELFEQSNNSFTTADVTAALKLIFYDPDEDSNPHSVTFSFNSETGEAIGKLWYRTKADSGDIIFAEHEEDVGDMLRSNYIILRDRNHPTENGTIVSWLNTNENTRGYSHRIYHDIPNGITDFSILYKNMYL